MSDGRRTVYRACNLCEAICGLTIEVEGQKIVSIRGDAADPFSRGHVCPKAVALQDIHDDPNRLRRPMRRIGPRGLASTGDIHDWTEIGWDEALDLAAEKLASIQSRYGDNAVGYYAGNPSVHNSGTLFAIPHLARVLNT